jgi:hypothetical protein
VRYTLQGSEPAEIMVQLECQAHGEWVQCRRYDTKHGFLHVHSAPWDEVADSREPVEIEDLKTGLNRAIADLKEGWQRYRRLCVGAKRRERR